MTTAARVRRLRAAWPARRLAVVVLAVAGTGVLLYPSAAAWFSARDHGRAVAGWTESVAATPEPVLRRALREARSWNEELPPVPLHDPYGDDRERVPAAELAAYERMLAPDDDGVVAVLRVPAIDVELPVRHGTGDASLSVGVGHLYGSSLPVGGQGTHAVLTAHSGQVGATLFDRLDEVVAGDEVRVQVLGEELVYRVDDVRTVLPREIESLARVAGEDRLTLVTCTPKGVNSHRILVRGTRVPGAGPLPASGSVDGAWGAAGPPWWAAAGAGALVVLLATTRRLAR